MLSIFEWKIQKKPLNFYLFEYRWPVGGMERTYVWDVSAKTAVNTATLIAHQHTAVNRSPARICAQRKKNDTKDYSTWQVLKWSECPISTCTHNLYTHKKGGRFIRYTWCSAVSTDARWRRGVHVAFSQRVSSFLLSHQLWTEKWLCKLSSNLAK